MTDDRKKAAQRIAKCRALAQSENANEAESALRQAKALMQKFQLTETDVAVSFVNESDARISTQKTPPYIESLSRVVANVFGCEALISGRGTKANTIRFIGRDRDAKAELAGYTFEVLIRHVKRDRKATIETLTRCGRATKIRRGDLFCLAWVQKIKAHVRLFAGNDDNHDAIQVYIAKHYGLLKKRTPEKRTGFRWNDDSAWHAGQNAAENVNLIRPVREKRGLYFPT